MGEFLSSMQMHGMKGTSEQNFMAFYFKREVTHKVVKVVSNLCGSNARIPCKSVWASRIPQDPRTPRVHR